MLRTVTFDYDDIHLVLSRSTVADARTRLSIFKAMDRLGLRSNDVAAVPYMLTQVVECQGLPFKKVTVCPSDDELLALVGEWEALDEMVAGQIDTLLVKLREMPSPVEKKASDTSSNGTSEMETTPTHSTTTRQRE